VIHTQTNKKYLWCSFPPIHAPSDNKRIKQVKGQTLKVDITQWNSDIAVLTVVIVL
jgi:hypothetical protein